MQTVMYETSIGGTGICEFANKHMSQNSIRLVFVGVLLLFGVLFCFCFVFLH